MKTEWKKCKLGDICLINTALYSTSDNYSFINYLDTGSITQNKIEKIQKINLSIEKLPSRAKRRVKYNSIIYSTVRPNQRHYGIIKNHPENFIVSTGFAVIDVDTEKANPDFIYYILIQDEIINSLQAVAEQSVSTYPSIKPSDIEKLDIFLPPLPVQKKIAGILKSLDDKIELNRQISKNLEEQARCLFDKTFPDSHKGKNKISDYILPQKGKNLQSKDAVPGSVPVVAGGLNPATYHNVANTSAPVITISASGANAGYVKLWNIPVWSSDSSYIDNSVTTSVYFWYILLKKRQNEIFDAQTGSAQPHIYPSHIGNMPMCSVSQEKMEKFHIQVTPLFELIGKNILENQKLSSLRDTLLPKLMNGEIEVSDMKC